MSYVALCHLVYWLGLKELYLITTMLFLRSDQFPNSKYHRRYRLDSYVCIPNYDDVCSKKDDTWWYLIRLVVMRAVLK